jgi:hypothetical protein
MRLRFHAAAAIVLASTFLGPIEEAKACRCGYSARVGRTEITQPTSNFDHCPVPWEPAIVRDWATWVVRIDALLPAGSSLEAFGAFATVKRGSDEREVEWHDLEELFDGVSALQSDPTRATRARSKTAQVHTVQIFASATRAGAERTAERANELDLDDLGFFFAGDAPAPNPIAHVVEEAGRGRRMHKVLIGAYLDERAAVLASRTLARMLGTPTFVRPL